MKPGLKEMLSEYLAAYDDINETLKQLPEEMWNFKPGPDKWSVKEILAHIVDSEANGYVRCRMAIAESGSVITAYDENTWAEALDYGNQSIKPMLELFKYLRVTTYQVLANLPPEDWDNYMEHPERGKETLYDWLRMYTEHVRIHINQMNRNLAAWRKKETNA